MHRQISEASIVQYEHLTLKHVIPDNIYDRKNSLKLRLLRKIKHCVESRYNPSFAIFPRDVAVVSLAMSNMS